MIFIINPNKNMIILESLITGVELSRNHDRRVMVGMGLSHSRRIESTM